MPTVLVVDDDRAINRLRSEALSDEGFTVRTATEGVEALRSIDRWLPDAILLDVRMPVMDGREFNRRLRADPREEVRAIPVIVLSAERARSTMHELGAQGAIEKPFDLDDVFAALRRVLRTTHEERASLVPAHWPAGASPISASERASQASAGRCRARVARAALA